MDDNPFYNQTRGLKCALLLFARTVGTCTIINAIFSSEIRSGTKDGT